MLNTLHYLFDKNINGRHFVCRAIKITNKIKRAMKIFKKKKEQILNLKRKNTNLKRRKKSV